MDVWEGERVIAVGEGEQPHPFSSPESEAFKWVSTTASSGPKVLAKLRAAADWLGLTPLLPLCHLFTTTAPPASVSPIESHTLLDQAQLPRDRDIPTGQAAWTVHGHQAFFLHLVG